MARFAASLVSLALFALAPAVAFALPDEKSGPATPLEQAREESSVRAHPHERYALPGGRLELSASELLASSGQRLELSVTLDRDVAAGSLEVTLPRRWVARAGVSGVRYARVPVAGRGPARRAGSRRADRVVTFAFDGGRAGDVARFELTDVGIPAGTYRLPYHWREPGVASEGTATVIFYAPTREAPQPPGSEWSRLANPGFEQNATNDALTESETFVTAVPGNRKRFVVGANGGGGYNAWVTNDGGQTFNEASVPVITDVPAEAAPETSNLCCDPMSAADSAGNIWYGGLSLANGAGQPSRIVVNRIAPGETSFQPFTVGLRQRTSGTQDKPMMTIDNSPSSPRFGRLYIVWDEPSGGGVNVVISQCDTRPGGVLNAANCDNADNWSAPVSVTPATGSYIYADVAAAPDGTVDMVWWDYSATNAIRGDSCGPAANCASAAGWGTPQTVATLDATGGTPIPFACPILAQPGGRAAPSPQLDVDRSGGSQNGRVYVTWSDLRAGSGTTKCAGPTAPAATHLSWDPFVASATGGLPGGSNPSSSVGTRLLTDGEGGGESNSDEWFPWLAVDQTSGQAWADFYSTRDDATRKTTNFYVRSVTPSGPGHALGSLTRVSGAASDYSATPCCTFANDYGDYTGIDATQGIALPAWSDNRVGADGEAYTFVRVQASLVAASQTLDDSAGDNDGVLEPGEPFALTQRLSNVGSAAATGVASTLSESLPDVALSQPASAYPDLAIGATQANGTPFSGSLDAAATCGAPLRMNLQVGTADGPFTVPVDVPTGEPGSVQVFSATPSMAIPDNSTTGVSANLPVSGVAGRLNDLDVRVNITHTFDSDLEIGLRAPNGMVIPLVQRRGGSGNNFTDTDLDDEAPAAISAGAAPFTGSFRPEHPLSTLDHIDPNGTWTLQLADLAGGDVGTLNSWRLSIRGSACSPPPAAPSLSGTDPASPASATAPRVLGAAPGGSIVRLYSGGACSGVPAASGTAAELASPGLAVTVPSGSTSEIRASATLGGLTSVCSAPLSYTQAAPSSGPPSGGPPGGNPPPPDTSVELDLAAGAAQRVLRAGGLRITVVCPLEACHVSASGRVTVPSPKPGGHPKRSPTRPATTDLRGGEHATLTLKLSASLRRQIVRALRSRRTRSGVRAALTATAADAAGNRQTESVAVRIRR